MNVMITASGGLQFMKQEQLYKANTSSPVHTNKNKIHNHCFSPSRTHCCGPERNPPHVLSYRLHIFHHLLAVCFSLNSLLIGYYKICPQFPFFVILIVHTLCNLAVWLAHFLNPNISPFTSELNCYPERGDSTFMQCQSKFIIQTRNLSFEKLVAVAWYPLC